MSFDLCLSFDEKYAVHAGVVISSLLRHAEDPSRFRFHVLDNGIGAGSKARIATMAGRHGSSVRYRSVRYDEIQRFPVTSHPLPAYARLLVGEIFPELDRILYLDSDVVVRGSLEPLFQNELDGTIAAVVPDALHYRAKRDHQRLLGMPEGSTYFNTGVMWINLEEWRKNEVLACAKRWVARHGEVMRFADQDVLNAILVGKMRFLDLCWNLQTPLLRSAARAASPCREMLASIRNAVVVHYTTGRKPWLREAQTCWKSLYWKERCLAGGPASLHDRWEWVRACVSDGSQQAGHAAKRWEKRMKVRMRAARS